MEDTEELPVWRQSPLPVLPELDATTERENPSAKLSDSKKSSRLFWIFFLFLFALAMGLGYIHRFQIKKFFALLLKNSPYRFILNVIRELFIQEKFSFCRKSKRGQKEIQNAKYKWKLSPKNESISIDSSGFLITKPEAPVGKYTIYLHEERFHLRSQIEIRLVQKNIAGIAIRAPHKMLGRSKISFRSFSC